MKNKRAKRFAFSAAVFAAVFLVSGAMLQIELSGAQDEETAAVTAEISETEAPPPPYSQLEGQLTDTIAQFAGDWSLYFEDYATGETIIINDHQVYSASLIKLFVIQAVYNEIACGSVSDSGYIEELLERMITWSDNESWRELARMLGGGSYTNGMQLVTVIAQNEGFGSTGEFMQGDRANYNFTSVVDCGTYLHRVLDGTIVSAEYSEKILELLKRQEVLHKIPAGVPEQVATANKTGELEYLEGDAAIVYAPSGTYILVIISQDMPEPGIAQIQIRELSSEVYNFRNNDPEGEEQT